MDFIIKLPKSKKLVLKVKYNLILVIIKRLTKYKNFVLYKKASIAKDLAYIINRVVITNHRMLDEFITDRDKLFISKF
jgi:hypothetical protein